MASISVSGTGSAAPTRGWARSLGRAFLAGAGALPLMGATPAAGLDVTVAGLRSLKGAVRVCLTTRPDHFPNCQDDPLARRLTVAAAGAATLRFANLPSGDYALALIHDENGNARLDTFAGIPREGVGFSRNPRLGFGPPRFAASAMMLSSGMDSETVRVRYFL